MNAKQILDREFLEIRAKILEIAASLDRIERAEGTVANDPNMNLLCQGIKILDGEQTDRAAMVQMLFSRAYADNWQEEFDISPRG